jgi:hypothetical protein
MRSSPFQRVQHNAQGGGFDGAADPKPIAARKLDLMGAMRQFRSR